MHILWSGPRESDISGLNIFCASTTIFGSNQENNRSYSKYKHTRVDHNQPDCVPNSYYNKRIDELISKYPDLKILYYNSIHSQYLPDEYKERVIGCNELSLLEFLDTKSDVRNLASRVIDVVPFQNIDNVNQLVKSTPNLQNGIKYILQENHASGGYGTHIIDQNSINLCIETFDSSKGYFLSPYFEKSFSVNVHCIIFDNDIIVCPGSVQIVNQVNNKINYLGSDFVEYRSLPKDLKESIKTSSKKFCEVLKNMRYRGVLGIDFLIINNIPHLLEVNARFQASTILLNRALRDYNLPSMQEIHLKAFEEISLKESDFIENIDVSYSMAAYTSETWKKDIECLKNLQAEKIAEIEFDGYDQTETIIDGAYLFHIIFKTNICSLNPEGTLWIYENLYDITNEFTKSILKKDLLPIKISLLNQGVKITDAAKLHIKKQGEIRNAVFSAVDLTIMNDLHINCPNDVKMVSFTPWKIDINCEKQLTLFYFEKEISKVCLDMADPHANRVTKSGLLYKQISFWATDRMRIHHTISCIFKKNDVGCIFCEIPKQDRLLSLDDIFEVIDFYLTQKNTFRHFLIGGGSESLDDEANHITQIAKYIRKKSDKPIYLMCLPPKDLSVLQTWYDAGITEIAFNLELFNRDKAKQYMPGKGRIRIEQYLAAFDEAVSIWGKNGNVRTLFIAGLETQETLLKGIETVCSRGVMPILSVFRALNNTQMEDIVPPSNEWLHELYNKAEIICSQYNLHLGPRCPACQNNTLSLPF